MSLAGNVARSLYSDLRSAAMTPIRFAEEAQYTINGLRDGTVPPKKVGWTIVSTIGAVALVATLMFPVYWIFRVMVDPTMSSPFSSGSAFIPAGITLDNVVWVFGSIVTPSTIELQVPLLGTQLPSIPVPEFLADIRLYDARGRGFGWGPGFESPSTFYRYLRNSVYVSVWTLTIGMSLVVPAAYAMSRRDFIGRKKLLYLYVLLTQVGGGLGIAVLIALFAIFTQLGLTNNKLALAIYYAATAVPFNTWLLKTYMDGIPTSYEEAAIVDGAPSWRVVYEIIIPLSKAGLATVMIFIFLAGWMEYIVAQTLLDRANYTLPVRLVEMQADYSISWNRIAAFALTFALPVMLVYLFAQRYIEAGLSFGGTEG